MCALRWAHVCPGGALHAACTWTKGAKGCWYVSGGYFHCIKREERAGWLLADCRKRKRMDSTGWLWLYWNKTCIFWKYCWLQLTQTTLLRYSWRWSAHSRPVWAVTPGIPIPTHTDPLLWARSGPSPLDTAAGKSIALGWLITDFSTDQNARPAMAWLQPEAWHLTAAHIGSKNSLLSTFPLRFPQQGQAVRVGPCRVGPCQVGAVSARQAALRPIMAPALRAPRPQGGWGGRSLSKLRFASVPAHSAKIMLMSAINAPLVGSAVSLKRASVVSGRFMWALLLLLPRRDSHLPTSWRGALVCPALWAQRGRPSADRLKCSPSSAGTMGSEGKRSAVDRSSRRMLDRVPSFFSTSP